VDSGFRWNDGGAAGSLLNPLIMSLSKDPALGRLILAWIPAFAGMTWVGNFLNYPFVLSSVEGRASVTVPTRGFG